MTAKNKHYFTFSFFNELERGDVFRFSTDDKNNERHLSKFFTVCHKDEVETKIGSTYGKKIHRFTIDNNLHPDREVLIFPDRSRK